MYLSPWKKVGFEYESLVRWDKDAEVLYRIRTEECAPGEFYPTVHRASDAEIIKFGLVKKTEIRAREEAIELVKQIMINKVYEVKFLAK